jgi:hypothetical protein
MAKRTSSVASQLNKKETLIVSATTVMRQRPPTNDFLTSKNPSMVWDYSQQRRVWPNGNPNALIEATQQTGTKYDTINKSGRPFALGNMEIGGDAQETNGDPLFEKATRKKMLKWHGYQRRFLPSRKHLPRHDEWDDQHSLCAIGFLRPGDRLPACGAGLGVTDLSLSSSSRQFGHGGCVHFLHFGHTRSGHPGDEPELGSPGISRC